jgi:hypothetical protein
MSNLVPLTAEEKQLAVKAAATSVAGQKQIIEARMSIYGSLCMMGQYVPAEAVREELHMLLDCWADTINSIYRMSREISGLV